MEVRRGSRRRGSYPTAAGTSGAQRRSPHPWGLSRAYSASAVAQEFGDSPSCSWVYLSDEGGLYLRGI